MKTAPLLLLLLASAPAAAQAKRPAAAPSAPRQAASTWSAVFDAEGEAGATLVNRTFSLETVASGDSTMPLLLAQEVRTRRSREWEGEQGRVAVTAWARRGGSFSRRLWTAEVDGARAVRWGGFLRVTETGCCATHDTDTYYDLLTGRRAFSATSRVAAASVTGGEVLVSFLGANGTVQEPEFGGEGVVGVLRTTAGSATLSRLVVRSGRAGLDVMDAPALVVAGWDEGTGERLRVLVHFADGESASVPMVGGRLVAGGAVLPAGMRIEPAR
ncbi:MAG TPA: hypothetical protein VF263_20855 [Longimicrobiaceae bacterium]